MPRRTLSSADALDLRQALHVAVLDALMASRRWAPGSLLFQGGTSLHLVHGSPRFSEDLDFLVDASLNLSAIAESVEARLGGAGWLPPDMRISVTRAKDGRNPHAFVVSIGGDNVLGAVRVKVELWRTDTQALAGVEAIVEPVRLTHGPMAGMQTFVPAASLDELHADKVFALAARPYLKPRDVFDLFWLADQGAGQRLSPDALRVRLATYPNETPAAWIAKARKRREELRDAQTLVRSDLERWLPTSWPLTDATVDRMIGHAAACLESGIGIMERLGEP